MSPLRQKLTAAACTLLALPVSSATRPWDIELGVMHFNEIERNFGAEFIASAKRETDDGGEVGMSAEIDAISGATPNGASASDQPQTFTMASGRGSYEVAANQLPVDDTHGDTRLALKAYHQTSLNDALKLDYNGLMSMEFDYLAFGLGGGLSWDLNRRNTTLLLGGNLEFNNVHPVGGTPIPFASMSAPDTLPPRDGTSLVKQDKEFSLGLNQILDRRSLLQLRATYSHFWGYLTDPYKILSLIEDQNAISLGSTLDYVFEQRPDSRSMQSLYLGYRRDLEHGVVNLGYRRYSDSWQVESDTIDLSYRWRLTEGNYLKPLLRLYRQSAASFYRHSLPASEPLPEYASADFRLAQFDATTLGLEYGRQRSAESGYNVSIEYYTQQGESHPADAIGLQQQQDLYPGLQAWLLKYVQSYRW